MDASEMLGRAAGVLVAPTTFAIAWLRRARMFHPRGIVRRVELSPHPECAIDLARVASRLAGSGIARLSSAWWKRGELPDALGIALRVGEQDLLFATIRLPITLPFAPLATDVHDFLANAYWATSPFDVDGVGRARIRLNPRTTSPHGESREERLAAAVAKGDATLDLQIKRSTRLRYEPFVVVRLEEEAIVDQSALHFDPFRAGRGFRPVGFVHGLRAATYAASQRARSMRESRAA